MKRTLVANWERTVDRYGHKLAFRTKKNKKWVDYTYNDIDVMARNLAAGLLTLRVRKGDTIGIISDDRLEWIVTDTACQLIGCPDVPRGSDSTADEIRYILDHAETKIVFVENEKQLEKILSIHSGLKKLKKIIVMDDRFITNRQAISIYDLMEKGAQRGEKGAVEVQKLGDSIDEEDLATIIYTSGTTGTPKGVMLRHRNFMHNVVVNIPLIGIYPTDHFLHILPVWHVFGRILEYIQIGCGASGAYTSIRELGNDLKDQKPTIMGSAPRLWESIYQRILDGLKKGSPVKRAVFFSAVTISKHVKQSLRALKGNWLKLTKPTPAEELMVQLKSILYLILFGPLFPVADKILGKVRMATGGRMRGTVSGGGALPFHIDEFFEAVGITVLEGYGLTETAPVLCVRTFEKFVPGSIGPVNPETAIQIRDEKGNVLPHGEVGVVWAKGPQVMLGYFKNEEATKKVLTDDGWFNTGDLGMFTFNDTLKLVGRAKDTIVLLGGENVEPVPIENALLESEYIHQVIVVGQDKKSLGALIVPEQEKLEKWLNEQHISFTDIADTYTNDKVLKLYGNEIKTRISAATGFKGFERITCFALIKKPFEVNDELTAIGKMKRHVICTKYNAEIEAMYEKI